MAFDFPSSPTIGQAYQGYTWDGEKWTLAATASALVVRSYLAGLTLSTGGGSAIFGIAAGVAADSTNAAMLVLAAAITKTTSAWAAGSGNGALDTGAIAPNTWYHVHLIKRVDTQVVDVLISLSPSAPMLPASYTLARRIGSLRTNASSQWISFSQLGDEFLWSAIAQDVVATNPGTAAVLRTLTVPLGVQVSAIMNVLTIADATVVDSRISLSSPDVTDELTTYNYNLGTSGGAGSASLQTANQFVIRTDTSSRIRTRHNASGTNTALYIGTRGWIDRRGRDA